MIPYCWITWDLFCFLNTFSTAAAAWVPSRGLRVVAARCHTSPGQIAFSSPRWVAPASTEFLSMGETEGLRWFWDGMAPAFPAPCSVEAGERFKSHFRSLSRRRGALIPSCQITLIQILSQKVCQQIYLYFYFSLTATSHQPERWIIIKLHSRNVRIKHAILVKLHFIFRA